MARRKRDSELVAQLRRRLMWSRADRRQRIVRMLVDDLIALRFLDEARSIANIESWADTFFPRSSEDIQQSIRYHIERRDKDKR